MLISLRFIVVVCTVMKCKHRISFVCMVGNISIFIDDYFRMVLHLFSENHFYAAFASSVAVKFNSFSAKYFSI